MKISDKEKLFILLKSAFLEIRAYSHEGENIKSEKIADLFHNMPSEAIASIRAGMEVDYSKLLDIIIQTSKHRGNEAWVTSKLTNGTTPSTEG